MMNVQQENVSKQDVAVPKDTEAAKYSLLNHGDAGEFSSEALEEALARLKHEGILTE